MSQFPPLDYLSPIPEQPQPVEQSARWPGLLAWAVIIVCVGFVMFRVARSYKRAAEQGITNPSSELQVQFLGKTAVGFKVLLPPIPNTKASPSQTTPPANSEQFIDSMDKYATSNAERVRVITVVAELLDSDKAIERIDKLQAKNPTPGIQEDLSTLRTIYTEGADAIDADARQRLIDRHGFFGRLSTVYGLKSSNAERTKVLDDAKTTAGMMMVLGLGFIVLLLIVGAAVVTAIVLAALGKFRRLYTPQRWINSAYLEAFAIYIASFILLSRLMAYLGLESLAWEWVLALLIPIVMLWVNWRTAGAADVRQGFGWNRGRGPLAEIPLGIFGYFAGIPVIVVGFFISLQLIKHTGTSPMHPIQKMLEGDKWHTLNLYGVACIFAPVMEETMFRGALLHHMRRRWNWLISSSVVAFIFAAIHPQGWTLIPALGAIAIVLAALREWRGSIWAPIAAHATNNFIVLTIGVIAAR